MASLNRVTVIGNLTRDLELRFSAQGMAVAKMGLAISKKTKGDGEKTIFVDVTLFGKTAENCAQFLKKGSPVFVEAELNVEEWIDKQSNQPRSKLA